jgi:transcriptional regulator with XRE-family HTH domain
MNIKEQFGIKVKNLRIKRGWSQEKLALTANIDRTYIPSIEKGERNVSITVIEKIANAFQIEIEFLMNFNSNEID